MPETVLERAHEKFAEQTQRFSRATSAITDAVENGLEMAKRAGKRGSDAVEEFMDDTTQRIKRHPTETVIMAFAAGFIMGGFVSWMTRRR